MRLTIDHPSLQDFAFSGRRIWADTNRNTGATLTTLAFCPSLREQALFVAQQPDTTHEVCQSRLMSVDEEIFVDGHHFQLATHQYPGTIFPRGYQHLQRVDVELFTQFHYQFGGVTLKKTGFWLQNKPVFVMLYEFHNVPERTEMKIFPQFAFRKGSALSKAHQPIAPTMQLTGQSIVFDPGHGFPSVWMKMETGHLNSVDQWYYRHEFLGENLTENSLPAQEDWYVPLEWRVVLESGSSTFGFVIGEPPIRNLVSAKDLYLQEKEVRQYAFAQTLVGHPIADQMAYMLHEDHIAHLLPCSLEDGILQLRALPGLFLATKKYGTAKNLLKSFGDSILNECLGQMANHKGSAEQQRRYVRLVCHYIVAAYRYFVATDDYSLFLSDLGKILEQFTHLLVGRRLSHVALSDGHVLHYEEHGQRTAYLEDNALWYNTLKIYGYLYKVGRYEKNYPGEFSPETVEQLHRNILKTFWKPEHHVLSNTNRNGRLEDHGSLGQIWALCLPFALMEGKDAKGLLGQVRLWMQNQQGNLYADSATALLWGCYMDAILQFEGISGEEEAHRMLRELETHLPNWHLNNLAPHQKRMQRTVEMAEIIHALHVHGLTETEMMPFEMEELESEEKGLAYKNPFSQISAFRRGSKMARIAAILSMQAN